MRRFCTLRGRTAAEGVTRKQVAAERKSTAKGQNLTKDAIERARLCGGSASSQPVDAFPHQNAAGPVLMERLATGGIVEILRNTLYHLEETKDFQQDDPAVIELKRHIVRSIAELEVIKSAHAMADADK
jgi:hypothetical protein